MQINSRIYQILGGMYANLANVYVIRANNSLIMIDCAETLHDFEIMMETLKKWHLDYLPISYVLLSHKHFGHIGNAKRLQDRGAKIIAGKNDAYGIISGNIHEIIDYSPFPEREKYEPCKVDYPVEDNDEILLDGILFKFISVPGHTSGSVVFATNIDDKDILFTGDVIGVTNDCRGASLGWEGSCDFNVQDYWNSLQKLAQCKCDWILPGHGQLCLQNGSKILQKAKGTALLKYRKPSFDSE